jgi:hypothetical protein
MTAHRCDTSQRTDEYGENHRHPGEVLNATVAEGEPLTRFPTAQQERDTQRDCSRRIADVVDSVSEEPDASRQQGNDKLTGRGNRQAEERPLYRPNATVRRGDRRIDDTVRVAVAVVVCGAMIVPMVMHMWVTLHHGLRPSCCAFAGSRRSG